MALAASPNGTLAGWTRFTSRQMTYKATSASPSRLSSRSLTSCSPLTCRVRGASPRLRLPLAPIANTSSGRGYSSSSSSSSNMTARPSGLVASKGIELLTWGTFNGFKASVMLEELREAYGIEYVSQAIDIGKNIQKEPWFTAQNPNGRIPVIVDHDNDGLAVFEGNAILSYLARRYDTANKFSFSPEDNDYTRAESWIGWGHGGVGPMQGQAFHFIFNKEVIPYGIQRYIGETERLYGVLDAHLRDRDYLVGPGRGRYSIADIALFGYANQLTGLGTAYYGNAGEEPMFPHVRAWLTRLLARPAVRRGLDVPAPADGSKRLGAVDELDEETARKRADVARLVGAAKKQYGYKYKSP